MQIAFGFGATEDLRWIRSQLERHFGKPDPIRPRTPIGQLVKSSISARTRDDVSLDAYRRLEATWPRWSDLAAASPDAIERVIADVTFADVKSVQMPAALRMIALSHPDFDLRFLGRLDVEAALAWLERLPGVGAKVSAATLNFSTLAMPAFVVDTHILRVARRLGFVRDTADTRTVHRAMMAMLDGQAAQKLIALHALMKRLGQTLCRPDRPNCRLCPIGVRCQTAARPRIPTSASV